MALMDETTQHLVGSSVWHAIRWIESHIGEMPYEIFSNPDAAEKIGYRVTIERIPYQPPIPLG